MASNHFRKLGNSMRWNARTRATHRGVPFDAGYLTSERCERFLRWSQGQNCSCCFQPYRTIDGRLPDKITPRDSLSLDALVPELGYVEGNTVLLCMGCNIRKSTHTLESLERMVKWYKFATDRMAQKRRELNANGTP